MLPQKKTFTIVIQKSSSAHHATPLKTSSQTPPQRCYHRVWCESVEDAKELALAQHRKIINIGKTRGRYKCMKDTVGNHLAYDRDVELFFEKKADELSLKRKRIQESDVSSEVRMLEIFKTLDKSTKAILHDVGEQKKNFNKGDEE